MDKVFPEQDFDAVQTNDPLGEVKKTVKELVVINDSVADKDVITSGLNPDQEVLVLDDHTGLPELPTAIVTTAGTATELTIGTTTYKGKAYSAANIATAVSEKDTIAAQDVTLTGFTVTSGKELVGDKIKITGGTAITHGGAIYNGGTATISGSTFAGNEAGTHGGAIYGALDSLLSISGSTFTGNTAKYGGALFGVRNSQISLSDSMVAGNKGGIYGGAIYSSIASMLSISGSTFTGNTANYGGAINNSNGTAAVINSFFIGNAASTGAAIYNTAGTATISNCVFSDNTADIYGGAIYNSGTATIRDSVFATETDTIYNAAGTLTLGGTITTAANINSTNAITFETGTKLVLDLSVYTAANTTAFLSNYNTAFNNNANFSITVNVAENQAKASYILAGAASSFNKSITITCGNKTSAAFSVGESVDFNGYKWTLAFSSSNAVLTVAELPTAIVTTAGTATELTIGTTTYQGKAYSANQIKTAVSEKSTIAAQDVTLTGFTVTQHKKFVGDAVTMTDNKAAFGGAICNYCGTATISGSMFGGNTCLTQYSNSGYGGAIYNTYHSQLTISGSTFANNAAILGGAIYNTYDSQLTISGSTFANNTASSVHFTSYSGYGGAIYNQGVLTISGSTFTGNTAGTIGGAIYNSYTISYCKMTIEDSVFATVSDTIYNAAGTLTLGGTIKTAANINSTNAITFETGTKLVLDLSVYTAANTTAFLSNYNTAFNNNANLSITVNVAENQAEASYILADTASSFNKSITITCGNETSAAFSVGESVIFNGYKYSLAFSSSNVVLTVEIPTAIVTTAGTATELTIGTTTYKGKAYSAGDIETAVSEKSTIVAQNVTFTENLRLSNREFVGDTVTMTKSSAWLYGGAIHIYGGTTTLVDSVFTGSTAGDYGGAIYNSNGGTATIQNSTFTDNAAGTYGGAIYNSGTMTIEASTFTGNTTSGTGWACDGGAIYNAQGAATIENSMFIGNTAKQGGAIYNTWEGTATIENSTFTGNVAKQGGAIHNGATAMISGSTFTGNAGSAIETQGVATIKNSIFTNNTAESSPGSGGGAIFNSGMATIENNIFIGNAAGEYGGAIYNYGKGTATIRDGVFATETDTIYNDGVLTLGGTITTAANINSTNAITFENGTKLVLDLSVYTTANTTAFLSNYNTAFHNDANFSITVNVAENQAKASYILADTASNFNKSITITCGNETSAAFSVGESVIFKERKYSLLNIDNDIVLKCNYSVVYANSAWSDKSAGDVVDVSGGTATIGINAFAKFSDAKAEEPETLVLEGGTSDDSYGFGFDGISGIVRDGSGRVFGGDIVEDGTACAQTQLTVTGGHFGSLFGGNRIIAGASGVDYESKNELTVSGGTFDSYAVGGDNLKSTAASSIRTGDIRFDISGGLFNGYVAGGNFISSENRPQTTAGKIDLTISGGTFQNRIYGGNIYQNRTYSQRNSHEDDIFVTLDASSSEIVIQENLICGNSGKGLVDGDVTLTVKGNGEYLKFNENSIVSGGYADGVIYSDGSFYNGVTGTSRAVFDDFTGDFSARLTLFGEIALSGSTMTLSNAKSNVRELSGWSFTGDSSLTLADTMRNDFSGDKLVIDVSGFGGDAQTLLTGGKYAIDGFDDFQSVIIAGNTATYNDIDTWATSDWSLKFSDDENDKKSMILSYLG